MWSTTELAADSNIFWEQEKEIPPVIVMQSPKFSPSILIKPSSPTSMGIPACTNLATHGGFWNGDALAFLCPCIVSNEGKNNLPSLTKDRWSAFRWVRLHSCCKMGRSQQELTGGSTTHLQPETNLVLNTSKHVLQGGLCGKGRRKIKPKTQVRVQGLSIQQLTQNKNGAWHSLQGTAPEMYHYFLRHSGMHF